MSMLDVTHKVLGETIVQHEKDIPGLYQSKILAYPNEPLDFLFEQREGSRYSRSDLLSIGYNSLAPLCDVSVIGNRQELLRFFLNDLNSDRTYFKILNIMHLINEWANLDRRYEGGLPELKKCAGFLRRYVSEAEKFTRTLKKQGGVLEKIAGDCERELAREDIELLIRACDRGEFDSIVVSKENGAFVFKGVVGDNRPVNVPHVSLGRFSLYEQTGGWTQGELVWTGFKKGLSLLNSTYSIPAALYFEADYMRRRQRIGKEVCLPEINENGKFEMEKGEPILATPDPKPRSFSFDRDNAMAILQGIHSAGKTYLICDIPIYIIRGLKGLALPARQASIPVTKRIFHALDIEKRSGGGSLYSELFQRAEELRLAREGDLFIVDEFLQHASPDAAEPLEPIILEEYEKTKATFIIVDHRGESIEDGNPWKFWSPEYIEHLGEIHPTFRFKRGKPDSNVLTRHSKQLLQKVAAELDLPKEEKKETREQFNYRQDRGENQGTWEKRIEDRVLGGEY